MPVDRLTGHDRDHGAAVRLCPALPGQVRAARLASNTASASRPPSAARAFADRFSPPSIIVIPNCSLTPSVVLAACGVDCGRKPRKPSFGMMILISRRPGYRSVPMVFWRRIRLEFRQRPYAACDQRRPLLGYGVALTGARGCLVSSRWRRRGRAGLGPISPAIRTTLSMAARTALPSPTSRTSLRTFRRRPRAGRPASAARARRRRRGSRPHLLGPWLRRW